MNCLRKYETAISDKWDVPWFTRRKCCITILGNAIEITVANTVKTAYDEKIMTCVISPSVKRFSSILSVFSMAQFKSPISYL